MTIKFDSSIPLPISFISVTTIVRGARKNEIHFKFALSINFRRNFIRIITLNWNDESLYVIHITQISSAINLIAMCCCISILGFYHLFYNHLIANLKQTESKKLNRCERQRWMTKFRQENNKKRRNFSCSSFINDEFKHLQNICHKPFNGLDWT